MKLSVIIVNYNVEYFLEQCILSVLKAANGLEVDIYMVDNASVDGSVKMVQEKFPSVIVVDNKENLGFSKANNQAMRMSSAEYVLLLNPDTVIEEDTLKKCITFMDERPDAGGLGVKMVDGKGIILPESKRGLPTPETAFYKITGLNKLFPSSKRINRYYLGHLSLDDTNEIEILSGAFMFMRKKALDEIGLLDEDFFMYGEDIDLSYRIILGGYKNYYFSETSIIHYKGESTKKGSLNYVFVFYNAMVIFAKKHFSSKNAAIFSRLINIAIWLRASWSILVRFIKKITLPAVDFLILFGLFLFTLQCYGKWQQIDYNQELTYKVLLGESVVYISSLLFSSAFRKPWKKWNLFKSCILGFAVSLGLYSLMPDTMRFSRAIILLSPLITGIYLIVSRGLLNIISKKRFPFRTDKSTKFGIIGDVVEFNRVTELISQTRTLDSEYIHFDIEKEKEKIEQIDELINVYNLNEIVFCAVNLSSSDIIRLMSLSSNKHVDFKIAPPESLYIIGSNSIDKKGDLFILDVNSISKNENKKKKRTFDLLAGILLFTILPVLIVANKSAIKLVKNLGNLIIGKKTLVGYAGKLNKPKNLPGLKPCIISTVNESASIDIIQKMNVLYARDYKWRNDLSTLIKNLRNLTV